MTGGEMARAGRGEPAVGRGAATGAPGADDPAAGTRREPLQPTVAPRGTVHDSAGGPPSPRLVAADVCRRTPGCETVAGERSTGLPTAAVHVEPMSGFVAVTQVTEHRAWTCWLTPGMARALAAALTRVADRADGRGQLALAWGPGGDAWGGR